MTSGDNSGSTIVGTAVIERQGKVPQMGESHPCHQPKDGRKAATRHQWVCQTAPGYTRAALYSAMSGSPAGSDRTTPLIVSPGQANRGGSGPPAWLGLPEPLGSCWRPPEIRQTGAVTVAEVVQAFVRAWNTDDDAGQLRLLATTCAPEAVLPHHKGR
jgi:hypothetical protein